MKANRRRVLRALAGAACALPALRAHAANNPALDKLVHIILGFPVGGTADNMARTLAAKLRDGYASDIIVENRPGARGVPAAYAITSADPDGSYLYMSPSVLATLWPHVYRSLPYDSARDFIPVSTVAKLEFALAVNADLPVNNLADYVKWAGANPGKALYGTLGPGSLPEFIGFGFAQAAGIKLTPVPYRGAAPGVLDLMGGRTPSWVGPLGDILAQVKTGKVKILATTGSSRSIYLAGVPTFTEAGYPVEWMESWGVFVRSGTPQPLIEKLNAALVKAVDSKEYRQTLAVLGYLPASCTPQEYAELIRKENARWGKMVADSGFQPTD